MLQSDSESDERWRRRAGWGNKRRRPSIKGVLLTASGVISKARRERTKKERDRRTISYNVPHDRQAGWNRRVYGIQVVG